MKRPRKRQQAKNHEDVSGPAVQLEDLRLDTVQFQRFDKDPSPELETMVNFELELERRAVDEMVVRMTLDLQTVDALEAKIGYVVRVRIAQAADQSKLEVAWQQAVARLVPVIVFPYLREMFSGLCMRSGIQSALLPVINAGRIWDPSEIEVPRLDEPGGEGETSE